MADAAPRPPLDPRKHPWHYGDVVTSGFKKSGFVVGSTPEYLQVMWMPDCIPEQLSAAEADNLVRVAHADSLSARGEKTNVEVLESMLALHRIETATRERIASCKTDAEKHSLDKLIERAYAKDGCDWDKAHTSQLLTLAIQPSEVGLVFKIQEWVHRLSCKKH